MQNEYLWPHIGQWFMFEHQRLFYLGPEELVSCRLLTAHCVYSFINSAHTFQLSADRDRCCRVTNYKPKRKNENVRLSCKERNIFLLRSQMSINLLWLYIYYTASNYNEDDGHFLGDTNGFNIFCTSELSCENVQHFGEVGETCTWTLSLCLMNDEWAAEELVCVCGGLQMIFQSFISSNSVSFRSCTLRLHKNGISSCELPQPIDPAPQTWIAPLWGSPASQTGFNHALSPNHGNLIYLKPLAVLPEPLYSLF